jgi:hypothetical protein
MSREPIEQKDGIEKQNEKAQARCHEINLNG